jgi:hypothetical protein
LCIGSIFIQSPVVAISLPFNGVDPIEADDEEGQQAGEVLDMCPFGMKTSTHAAV